MTKIDKEVLIEIMEKLMPNYNEAKKSSYLAGKRDAYLSAITEITSFYYEENFPFQNRGGKDE